jgi:DNA-directed RNA polymerase subunit RPC12/RpoP
MPIGRTRRCFAPWSRGAKAGRHRGFDGPPRGPRRRATSIRITITPEEVVPAMEATKIAVKCSECGAKYSVPENYGRRQIQCRKCGKIVFIKGEETSTRRATAPRPVAPPPPPVRSGSKLALVLPLVALVASLAVIVVVLKMFLLK